MKETKKAEKINTTESNITEINKIGKLSDRLRKIEDTNRQNYK
jgi:hypothetical protein